MYSDLSEIRILHVEDDDKDAYLVKHHLGKAGLVGEDNYARTKDIRETLKYLSEHQVDIVVLDLLLPDSKGMETLTLIKTQHPKNAIIVITGNAQDDAGLQAVNLGAQDYLLKDELNSRSITRVIKYAIERHNYDQKIVELANVDTLTGLPNRLNFIAYLEQILKTTQRLNQSVSLLFIDCDSFKVINDTYGHALGDEFLIKFTDKLRGVVRSSDFIARLGGDEFVAVLPFSDHKFTSPEVVVDKIFFTLQEGIQAENGLNLDARCSIGVTHYQGGKELPSPDKFLQEADAAMYNAKARGGNCASFFNAEMEEKSKRRLQLLRLLALAYQNKNFTLNYQAIVDAKHKIVGLEALMRWTTSEGEIISPEEFIPLLEENGMLEPIGYWIIKTACTDFVDMQSNGELPPDAWLSLNISPSQLRSEEFVEKVTSILIETIMAPTKLHFEITEGLLMDHNEQTLDILHKICGLGCKWVIDDFGIGYSSMGYLKTLPLSMLKIDKSFVQNSLKDARDRDIVRAMISLAHNLGMEVVAEGIETLSIARVLSQEGCDFLQGYWFSRPLSIKDFQKSSWNYKNASKNNISSM